MSVFTEIKDYADEKSEELGKMVDEGADNYEIAGFYDRMIDDSLNEASNNFSRLGDECEVVDLYSNSSNVPEIVVGESVPLIGFGCLLSMYGDYTFGIGAMAAGISAISFFEGTVYRNDDIEPMISRGIKYLRGD